MRVALNNVNRDYLAGDLRTTRLGLLSLHQRKADSENEEKGQKKVAEVHGCELLLERRKVAEKTRESRVEASLQWRAEKPCIIALWRWTLWRRIGIEYKYYIT